MYFFSLIHPTPEAKREAALQWAKGPYGDHQFIWQFLKAEKGTQRDFLFRRCVGSENSPPSFYVVSKRPPQQIHSAWQVQTREYHPKLTIGQKLAFELRANPVITHKLDNKSRRDDVVIHEKKKLLAQRGLKRWADWVDEDKPELYELIQTTCSQWLAKRGESKGFQVETNSLRVDGYTQHKEKNRGVFFSTVDFSGELIVTNPEQFNDTLFSGIGHSKAFGCGLMLVRRYS